MKIVDVRETVVPISSEIRNAYIDFTQMTVSVVAVTSDVEIGGRRIAGFGFNSNGRYAPSGLLRERFIPRLLAANPCDLVDETRDNFDPSRVWAVLMKNEARRSWRTFRSCRRVLDMALWDLVAKIAGRRSSGYWRNATAAVFLTSRAPVCGWRLLLRTSDLEALRREMRSYLERSYSTVKMKIGGTSLEEDLRCIEAVLKLLSRPDQLAVDANGRFDLETAIEYTEALAAYGLR